MLKLNLTATAILLGGLLGSMVVSAEAVDAPETEVVAEAAVEAPAEVTTTEAAAPAEAVVSTEDAAAAEVDAVPKSAEAE